jgi:hypothetical protein
MAISNETLRSSAATAAALGCLRPLPRCTQTFHAPQVLGFHRENQGNARDVAHLGPHDFLDGLPMGPFERGELDCGGQFFSHARNLTAKAGLILISLSLFSSRLDGALAPECQ